MSALFFKGLSSVMKFTASCKESRSVTSILTSSLDCVLVLANPAAGQNSRQTTNKTIPAFHLFFSFNSIPPNMYSSILVKYGNQLCIFRHTVWRAAIRQNISLSFGSVHSKACSHSRSSCYKPKPPKPRAFLFRRNRKCAD